MSQPVFFVVVTLFLASFAPLAAAGYFRWVRLSRPAIGVFDIGDVFAMMGFVVVLPFVYLALPGWALPTVLGLVFAAGLGIGYEPVVTHGWWRRGLILSLLGVDLAAWAAWRAGAAPTWFTAVNSVVVMLIAVSAANLSAQGGLKLRHAAWFTLGLAVYDLTFATAIPITQKLAEAIQGYPYAPSAGLRVGELSAVIGMGDLLAYALYGATAYKAYGRTGLRASVAIVAVFGALLPTLSPLAIEAITGRQPSLIPAQVFFGPAAFVGYLVLRRLGAERRMVDVLGNRPFSSRPHVASGHGGPIRSFGSRLEDPKRPR
ncbi:hypothetical protein [Dactylosporangium sp. NPDC000521]|uniref:hypothetical protein n=1 Tax=Dactylosporangium sp. NPDC000521 TaxID=3363975 RepID=UPI00369D1C9D